MFVFGVDTRMQFSHSPRTTLGLFLLQWQQQAGSDDGEPLQDQREPRFQAPVLGTDMCSPPVRPSCDAAKVHPADCTRRPRSVFTQRAIWNGGVTPQFSLPFLW